MKIGTDLLVAQSVQLSEYAFFLMDLNGVIQTWNAGVERLFGYSRDEWIGQHASIIFTPSDKAMDLCEAELGIAQEKGKSSDIRWHRKKDGTELFAHGVIETVRDDFGGLLGFTKIVSDETERKRLQDSLIQANAALEHFAYGASHDLQEPLRTVHAFAQLLLRDTENQLSATGAQHLGYIVQAVTRMSSLITDLLTYARAGVEEQPPVSISLDDEVEAATSQLKAAIDEAQAVVTHDPLPTVTVEHAQITRLFLNLISNAIKYRAADRKPHVHISAVRADNAWATVAIRDNGKGFSPEYAETIFEPFTRLQRDEHSGSGVGLTICRRIVERSGGRMWAESEPGQGSTFYFTLPLSLES
ncbi:MAG: sensor histidine kinase [Bryobacteraceae bacterium]